MIEQTNSQRIQFATRSDELYPLTARMLVRSALTVMGTWSYEVSGRVIPHMLKNRVQFLCLHHLFPDEESAFHNLLIALSQEHTFVTYTEAVARIRVGNIDRPYLTLSFDDGVRNCVQASRIMSDNGVRGCFFVCPSMIAQTDPHKIQAYCSQRLLRPPMELLTWEDLHRIGDDGHEIGCHTSTHANLANLEESQLQDEIAMAYEMLVARVGQARHFAWPYGRWPNFSAIAAKMVFDVGFDSCASAELGCHVAQEETRRALCLRRLIIDARCPLRQIRYLLARCSARSSPSTNGWPDDWSKIIDGTG